MSDWHSFAISAAVADICYHHGIPVLAVYAIGSVLAAVLQRRRAEPYWLRTHVCCTLGFLVSSAATSWLSPDGLRSMLLLMLLVVYVAVAAALLPVLGIDMQRRHLVYVLSSDDED